MKLAVDKITLPIAIIFSVSILALVFFFVQYTKQKSVERQQVLELQEKRQLEESKNKQAEELAKKEYAADRKNDCLNIYKTEGAKWNNVRGWRYDEEKDNCYISYKDNEPKTDAECDKLYLTKGEYGYLVFRANLLCKDGEFENSF